MRSVDERIVDMQFNNKQFEDGIQTSLRSLGNLRKSLDETGNGNALSSIQTGVDAISGKFSAMGVMAVQWLQNMANAAWETGRKIVNALAIEPITDGFREYELKMGSTQTIMAGSGEDLDTVNKYLEELNQYADRTIYSFKDMTSNIGKFTNAGVKLDAAVSAIQGVSNLAALSGSDANEASRAMYNFAQALSAGYVKLIDWKSIENANMATVEFKNQLLDTAVAAGTLEKTAEGYYAVLTTNAQGRHMADVIDAAHNFNDSLAYQWMTTDVLVNTLQDYADETTDIGKRAFAAAQDIKTFTQMFDTLKEAAGSGWAQSFELIFGNFEEAKVLWTDLGEVLSGFIEGTADARNEMLQFWKDAGGRDALILSLKNAFGGLASVLEPIGEAFRTIFPPVTGQTLLDLTDSFKAFADRLKVSEETADKIRRTFAGIFALIDLVKDFFGAVFIGVRDALSTLLPFTGIILDATAGVGDFIVNLRNAAAESDFFKGMAEGVTTVLITIFDVIGKVVTQLAEWGTTIYNAAMESEAFHAIIQGIADFLGSAKDFFIDAATGVRDFVASLQDANRGNGFWGTVAEGIKTVLGDLKDFLGMVGDGIKTAVEKIGEHLQIFGKFDLNPLSLFSRAVNIALHPFTAIVGLFKTAWEIIVDILKWATPYVQKAAAVIGPAIKGLFGAFGEALRNGDFTKFLGMVNTGILGLVLLRIKEFFEGLKDVSKSTSGILDGVTEVLDGVRGCFETWQQNLQAKTLLTIAMAIGILAAALWVLSGIPGDKMLVAIGGLTTLVAELAAAMVVMGKSFKSFKGGTDILLFSAAVLILALALKSLSELSWDELQIGLTGVTALIIELTTAAMIMSKSSGKMVKGGIGLMAMATAILILAQAVKSLSTLDPMALTAGLIGIGVIMAEIAGFTQIVKPQKLLSTGVAMIAMGAALKIMAGVVNDLAGLDPLALTQGLLGLGMVLAEIAGFTRMVKPEKLMSVGIAMIAMGAAIKIMSSAVKTLGEMDMAAMAQGLVGMGVALAGIAGFTHIVKPDKMMSTGVALIAVGAALLLIAQAIQSFGEMTWEEMAKGLIMLGGSLLTIAVGLNAMKGAIAGAAVMTVFALALGMMVPALLVFGHMGWDEIGKSLLMLAGILAVFGGAAMILAPVVPIMLGLAGAIALLGVGVLALGVGMVALSAGLTSFALGGPAFIAGLTAMLAAVILLIPTAMAALVEGLVLMIATLAEGIGTIIDSLVVILKAVIDALIILIPDVVAAVFKFLSAMADALIEFIPKLVALGLTLILSLLRGMADNIQEVTKTVLQIVEAFLLGLADGIPGVIAAAVEWVSQFIMALGREIPNLVDAGFKMIIDLCNGLADAIRENSYELGKAAVNLAAAIIEGLVRGLLGGIVAVVEGIVNVGKALWEGFKKFFGIKSPSTLMEGEGGNIMAGLLNGLSGGIGKVVDKAKEIGRKIFEGIKGAVGDVTSIATNICDTLGNTLKNGVSTVTDAAKNVGNGVLKGVKKVLGIKSPARAMIEIAHYTGDGLIEGFWDMMRPVAVASSSLGSAAITGMQHSLKNIADLVDGEFDLAPVIRPVIDMRDVQKSLEATFANGQVLNVGEIKGKAAVVASTPHYQNGMPARDKGDTVTDNSEEKIEITVNNMVRDDSDIHKINRGLDNIITKYRRTKGVRA